RNHCYSGKNFRKVPHGFERCSQARKKPTAPLGYHFLLLCSMCGKFPHPTAAHCSDLSYVQLVSNVSLQWSKFNFALLQSTLSKLSVACPADGLQRVAVVIAWYHSQFLYPHHFTPDTKRKHQPSLTYLSTSRKYRQSAALTFRDLPQGVTGCRENCRGLPQ